MVSGWHPLLVRTALPVLEQRRDLGRAGLSGRARARIFQPKVSSSSARFEVFLSSKGRIMRIAKHGLELLALSAGLCTPLAGQAPAGTGQALTLHGTCDGSAAVWIDDEYFVDANDEDPVLRVYSAKDGKLLAKASLDLAATLGLDPGGEPDIEGSARVGDRIYWITSHGLDNDNVVRPERHRLFATSLKMSGGKPRLRPTGRVFYGLLKAIDKAAGDMPDLAALNLS